MSARLYARCGLCTGAVRGDAVGTGSRRGAAGRGGRRHGAATQAGAQHAHADRQGRQETTQHDPRRRGQPLAVARPRQTQAQRRPRHTRIVDASAAPYGVVGTVIENYFTVNNFIKVLSD